LQILLLAQHVSGTTMPIIRSSRVLYSGCCLWYFVLWVFKLLVWCGAEGYVSGLQDPALLHKMPIRCNMVSMFRAPLCPSSGAQEYYTVVAACGISCCGFSSCWSRVELRVMCPVCRILQHPANRTHNPLPDNTQHSQQTNIHAPVGFEPKIATGERP